jgi:LysR family transcriptional regulator, transcriptional activator of nhaA
MATRASSDGNASLKTHGNSGTGSLAAAPELPKIIVRQYLTPVFELGRLVRVICREGSLEELITPLAGHKLDVVLA